MPKYIQASVTLSTTHRLGKGLYPLLLVHAALDSRKTWQGPSTGAPMRAQARMGWYDPSRTVPSLGGGGLFYPSLLRSSRRAFRCAS